MSFLLFGRAVEGACFFLLFGLRCEGRVCFFAVRAGRGEGVHVFAVWAVPYLLLCCLGEGIFFLLLFGRGTGVH